MILLGVRILTTILSIVALFKIVPILIDTYREWSDEYDIIDKVQYVSYVFISIGLAIFVVSELMDIIILLKDIF